MGTNAKEIPMPWQLPRLILTDDGPPAESKTQLEQLGFELKDDGDAVYYTATKKPEDWIMLLLPADTRIVYNKRNDPVLGITTSPIPGRPGALILLMGKG